MFLRSPRSHIFRVDRRLRRRWSTMRPHSAHLSRAPSPSLASSRSVRSSSPPPSRRPRGPVPARSPRAPTWRTPRKVQLSCLRAPTARRGHRPFRAASRPRPSREQRLSLWVGLETPPHSATARFQPQSRTPRLPHSCLQAPRLPTSRLCLATAPRRAPMLQGALGGPRP